MVMVCCIRLHILVCTYSNSTDEYSEFSSWSAAQEFTAQRMREASKLNRILKSPRGHFFRKCTNTKSYENFISFRCSPESFKFNPEKIQEIAKNFECKQFHIGSHGNKFASNAPFTLIRTSNDRLQKILSPKKLILT